MRIAQQTFRIPHFPWERISSESQNCTKIRLGPFQVQLNCWSAARDEQKK